MTTTVSVAENQPKFVTGVDIRVDKSTNTYDITIDVGEFIRGMHQNDLFYVWLLKRGSDERVNFTFTRQTGFYSCSEGFLTFLNALRLCQATTVARVDHMHEGVCAWAVLTCDQLATSDFGLLQLSPITSPDGRTDTLTAQLKASADYIFFLYERAVERGWMTQDEVTALATGSVVFITPDTLKERTK